MIGSRRFRYSMAAVTLAIGLALWLRDDSEPAAPSDSPPARQEARTEKTARAAPRRTAQPVDAQPEAPKAAPDQDTILCQIAGGQDLPDRIKVRLLTSTEGHDGLDWTKTKDTILLHGAAPTGTAVLRMRGHPGLEFSWNEEGCGPIVLGQTATVRGVVNYAYLPGTQRTQVRGCGARGPVEEDGTFEIKVAPEPCELVARRFDGPLVAISDSVFLEPEVGDILEVEMDLPRHRQAGVGFSWNLVAGGIEVMGVHEDTPASDVGLQAGDTIIEVDGESTEDMNRGDVRRTIGGQAGTAVQLLVLREDEEIELEFERESLDHAIPEDTHPRPRHGKRGKDH